MMRIAYYGPGTTTHDRRWVNALAETGWEVTMLRTDGKNTPGYIVEGVNVVNFSSTDVAELRQWLREEKIDLLVAGPLHRHGHAACKSGFLPCILVSWGSDVLWEAQHDDEARKNISAALKSSSGWVVDCAAVYAAARQLGGCADKAVLTIPWGVERSQQAYKGTPIKIRQRAAWPDDVFVAVTNRAMAPIYQVEVVIRAFARAVTRHERMRLLVLGSGPLEGEMRALASGLGLNDFVYFGGRVDEDMMAGYLAESDVYVSASASDGSSVSLMQALWAGLPVIVTDIPSNREWVSEGEHGWLVSNGDVHGYAEAMGEAVILSPDLRLSICQVNRQMARERADWVRHAEAFRSFCEQIVADDA